MHLRSKLDGSILEANLERQPRTASSSRFVLHLQNADGQSLTIGSLEATIGYELFDWTAAEFAALVLAGFRLTPAEDRPSLLSLFLTMVRDRSKMSRRALRGEAKPGDRNGHNKSTSPPKSSSKANGLDAMPNLPHSLTSPAYDPSGPKIEARRVVPARTTRTKHARHPSREHR
jgi:hypothetical protein